MPRKLPTVFYGLHIYPGLAGGYPTGERLMLNEQTLRDMDKSFEGCPVYVDHKEEVDLDNLQTEADGYVISSFYNSADGKHWCKFIVVSDKGHEAVRNGWRLSNAYVPESFAQGGLWNGIEYDKEITRAKYEHLAIVPTPRYQDSVIFTPTQFKAYNDENMLRLSKVANSVPKKETSIMSVFTFFKKTKVENSDELNDMIVTLPSTGKEISLAQLIKDADVVKNEDKSHHSHEEERPKQNEAPAEIPAEEKKEEKKHDAPQMANMDHLVTVGASTMSVKAMSDCMNSFHEFMTKKNSAPADKEDKDEKKEEKSDKTENALPTPEVAITESAPKESDTPNHFEMLRNAHQEFLSNTNVNADFRLTIGQVERGQARYGSGN